MPSISKIFIIDEMHKHTSVKKSYMYKRTLKINDITIPSLYYCDICNIYMCSKSIFEKEYKNTPYSKMFKNIRINDYIHDTCYVEKKLGDITINKYSSFSCEHKGHMIEKRDIDYKNKSYSFDYCCECDTYSIDDKFYDYIKDNIYINDEIKRVVINKYFNFDIRRNFYTYHMNHKIKDVFLRIDNKDYKTQYCIDCDMYNLSEKLFNTHIGNSCKGTVLKDLVISKYPNIPNNIEFLIRINSFRCKTRNHTIEEIIAVVSVYDKFKDEVVDIEIPAFYCKNCKLFFIYDSEYRELIKHGIPTCPVHEEVKYFSNVKGFDTYESESLLRQFGYNVNSQENLSTTERRKIIQTVIKNGIMNKSDVLSLLNFLSSSRKNQIHMQNAVSKWESDIKYTRNLSIDCARKVRIGAFRKKVSKAEASIMKGEK